MSEKARDYISRNKDFLRDAPIDSHILEVAEHWNNIMLQNQVIDVIRHEIITIVQNCLLLQNEKTPLIDEKLQEIKDVEENIMNIVCKF